MPNTLAVAVALTATAALDLGGYASGGWSATSGYGGEAITITRPAAVTAASTGELRGTLVNVAGARFSASGAETIYSEGDISATFSAVASLDFGGYPSGPWSSGRHLGSTFIITSQPAVDIGIPGRLRSELAAPFALEASAAPIIQGALATATQTAFAAEAGFTATLSSPLDCGASSAVVSVSATLFFPPPYQVSLLPPNASRYMRTVEQATRLPEDLWAFCDLLDSAKILIPDDAIPFLLWEYGLEPITPWVSNLRRVLREGRSWQRIRGTDASILQALDWIDFKPKRIEESSTDTWWDLFQFEVDPPVTSKDRLAAILGLTRLSKPAHTDIIRIYNAEYDLRALMMNGGPADMINGSALVNDWSGAWVQSDWPKLSYGRTLAGRLDASGHERVRQALDLDISGVFNRTWGFIVNRGLINGPDVIDPRFCLSESLDMDVCAFEDFTGRGGYGSQPWADGPIGWIHPGEDILTSAPNPATEFMVDGDGILNDASISAQLIVTGVDITPVASIAVNRHRLNRDKFNAFGEPQDLLPAIPLYKDYAYGARADIDSIGGLGIDQAGTVQAFDAHELIGGVDLVEFEGDLLVVTMLSRDAIDEESAELYVHTGTWASRPWLHAPYGIPSSQSFDWRDVERAGIATAGAISTASSQAIEQANSVLASTPLARSALDREAGSVSLFGFSGGYTLGSYPATGWNVPTFQSLGLIDDEIDSPLGPEASIIQFSALPSRDIVRAETVVTSAFQARSRMVLELDVGAAFQASATFPVGGDYPGLPWPAGAYPGAALKISAAPAAVLAATGSLSASLSSCASSAPAATAGLNGTLRHPIDAGFSATGSLLDVVEDVAASILSGQGALSSTLAQSASSGFTAACGLSANPAITINLAAASTATATLNLGTYDPGPWPGGGYPSVALLVTTVVRPQVSLSALATMGVNLSNSAKLSASSEATLMPSLISPVQSLQLTMAGGLSPAVIYALSANIGVTGSITEVVEEVCSSILSGNGQLGSAITARVSTSQAAAAAMAAGTICVLSSSFSGATAATANVIVPVGMQTVGAATLSAASVVTPSTAFAATGSLLDVVEDIAATILSANAGLGAKTTGSIATAASAAGGFQAALVIPAAANMAGTGAMTAAGASLAILTPGTLQGFASMQASLVNRPDLNLSATGSLTEVVEEVASTILSGNAALGAVAANTIKTQVAATAEMSGALMVTPAMAASGNSSLTVSLTNAPSTQTAASASVMAILAGSTTVAFSATVVMPDSAAERISSTLSGSGSVLASLSMSTQSAIAASGSLSANATTNYPSGSWPSGSYP